MFRKSTCLCFGKQQSFITPDCKDASTAFNKTDIAAGKCFLQFVRKTCGAGKVVSNHTIFDLELHRNLHSFNNRLADPAAIAKLMNFLSSSKQESVGYCVV